MDEIIKGKQRYLQPTKETKKKKVCKREKERERERERG